MKMMPGQQPYTEDEWRQVSSLISDVAAYLERVGDDVAEYESNNSNSTPAGNASTEAGESATQIPPSLEHK